MRIMMVFLFGKMKMGSIEMVGMSILKNFSMYLLRLTSVMQKMEH